MRYLRTNTATRITVGPFLDKTDGITPEVALTVTSEKLTFVVDTGGVPTLILDTAPTASGGANDMVHITGDDSGFYDLELAAADVNYVGRAMLSLNDVATHCPVFHEFMIVPAVIYDAMVLGTDLFDISMTQILGTAVSTPATAGILDVNVKNMNNVAGTSITTINANQGTTEPVNFTGTGASALAKSDMVDIAGAAVNTASAQVGTNVVSQANIDFGALQKASIETACDATVGGGTGTALTAIPWNAAWDAEVQSEVDDALVAQRLDELLNADSDIDGVAPPTVGSVFHELLTKTAGSFTYDQSTDSLEAVRDNMGTAQTGDSYALANGASGFVAIKGDTATILTDTGTTLDARIPAALVGGRMDASVGAVADGAITAAAIANGAIDNATLAADIGSTAFATNIIALAVFKALDEAITDGVSLTTGGLLEKVRKLSWLLGNKIEVTDASGTTKIYKDDNSTVAYQSPGGIVNMLTDDSTTTTRLRAA